MSTPFRTVQFLTTTTTLWAVAAAGQLIAALEGHQIYNAIGFLSAVTAMALLARQTIIVDNLGVEWYSTAGKWVARQRLDFANVADCDLERVPFPLRYQFTKGVSQSGDLSGPAVRLTSKSGLAYLIATPEAQTVYAEIARRRALPRVAATT